MSVWPRQQHGSRSRNPASQANPDAPDCADPPRMREWGSLMFLIGFADRALLPDLKHATYCGSTGQPRDYERRFVGRGLSVPVLPVQLPENECANLATMPW
jgi:hypothetical protein